MGACFGQPVVKPMLAIAPVPKPKKEEVDELMSIIADEIRVEEENRVIGICSSLNQI